MSSGNAKPVQYQLKDLKRATDRFSNSHCIGKGGFGDVYKGKIDGQIVAIKKLQGNSVKLIEDIGKEVGLLYSLENDNLVKLLGFCVEAGSYILVYEYISNGNLHTWLTDETKRQTLNWEHRVKIIKGIAGGLSYLHNNSENVIIHCDLKPENILLDEDCNAKVTDFGLSKIVDINRTHMTMRRIAGTPGYIAPEVWTAQHYSEQSDVFSFGLLIFEILVGSTIGQYVGSNGEQLSHVVWKKWNDKSPLLEMIDSFVRDNRLEDQMEHYMLIGLLCVQHNRHNRPKMEQVLKMLDTNDALSKPSFPAFLEASSISRETAVLPKDPNQVNTFQASSSQLTETAMNKKKGVEMEMQKESTDATMVGDDYVLTDNGIMSFGLDKPSGAKCYMISARALHIEHGHNSMHWKWIALPDSRFAEGAELVEVYWLEIHGKMKRKILTPLTTYAAYFVFKLRNKTEGLHDPLQETNITLDGNVVSQHFVCLHPEEADEIGKNVFVPIRRGDGWMEIEMGEFYSGDRVDYGELDMSLKEVNCDFRKEGLIIQGIEVRPKH